ncbi:MAG TPA: CBS domain-containing protein [Anaerolineae bacterium]|nr:CBS domain-containing protein [Anaerolineae bacterium]
MLVRDYMTRHPLMAEPDMSIVEAQRYMGESHVRHLPIVGDGKRLVGLVTRQTLLVDPGRLGSLDVWEITRYLSGLAVKDVMVKAEQVVTVSQDTTIEEAARIMVEHKVGCLPVLEEGVVVGIITEVDLLAHLMEMMATRAHGVRVTVRMPNVKGELAKLVGAIAAQGWGILACGGAPTPKDPTQWDAVLKIQNVPQGEIVATLGRVAGQKIVDVREM